MNLKGSVIFIKSILDTKQIFYSLWILPSSRTSHKSWGKSVHIV